MTRSGTWAALVSTIAAALASWSVPATASEPTPLPWSSLLEVAASAWRDGPGRAPGARIGGEERAAREVAGALEGLNLEARPELAHERSEVALAAILELRLGVGDSRTRAARARIAQARAHGSALRFAFEREAITRWVSWQEAALRVEHLTHHRAIVDAELGPVRAAVQARLLAELVGEGLEVELVRMDLELDQARVDEAQARLQLAAWLGRDVAPVSVPAHGGEADDAAPVSRWAEVLAHLEGHPELVELAAAARAVRAEAAALERAEGPVLGLGASVRRETAPGEEVVWGGLDVSLRWPLTRMSASDAARLRAEAVALEASAEVRRVSLTAEIEARAAHHAALSEQLARLRNGAVPRLAGRAERLAHALRAGRASLEALILARRDALELHHEEAQLIGRLLASALESEAMLGLLREPGDPGGGER